MKEWFKSLLGFEVVKKKEETPKASWIKENEEKEIKDTLLPDVKNLTSYEYEMISKRNRLSTLPKSNPTFLKNRIENEWRHKARFIVGVDTPLPKHYKEMVQWWFSLDFEGFEKYAKAKKKAWLHGRAWQV